MPSSLFLSLLGYAYGRAGQRKEAEQVLKELQATSKRTYVSPYMMSFVYLGLGDKDETFRCFNRVFEERALSGVVSLKVNPVYDELRSDPRFITLLHRAGFTE